MRRSRVLAARPTVSVFARMTYTRLCVRTPLTDTCTGLLEEKGITTQSAAAAAAGKKTEEDKAEKADKTAPDSPDSKKEKASLKDKIKAKLHKN